jgi:hypothetical protein
VCKESDKDSPDCSVYARRRATEVWRRRSWVFSEVLPSPSAGKASRATSEDETGAGWSRWSRLGQWWRAEEKLAGAMEGRLVSEGEHRVR